MLRKYEIPFAVSPDLIPQAISAVIDKIRSIIHPSGGKIVSSEYWGVRSFAYKVKNSNSGRYYLLVIEINPILLKEIDGYFVLNDSILRYAILSSDETMRQSEIIKNLDTSVDDVEYRDLIKNK